VRVSVKKGDQRFELTGLIMEPLQKRTTQSSSSMESSRDSARQR